MHTLTCGSKEYMYLHCISTPPKVFRGVPKAKYFKGNDGANLEFPERWGEGRKGFISKHLPWEGYGYFLEKHSGCYSDSY